MANAKTLSLSILDREYRVNCPEGAEDKLRDAARMVHQKMTDIKSGTSSGGKILSTDSMAVLAALNIAHQLRELEAKYQALQQDANKLNALLDEAIAQEQQLEL